VGKFGSTSRRKRPFFVIERARVRGPNLDLFFSSGDIESARFVTHRHNGIGTHSRCASRTSQNVESSSIYLATCLWPKDSPYKRRVVLIVFKALEDDSRTQLLTVVSKGRRFVLLSILLLDFNLKAASSAFRLNVTCDNSKRNLVLAEKRKEVISRLASQQIARDVPFSKYLSLNARSMCLLFKR